MIVGARAVRWGVTAAGLLAGLYAAIVGGASGLGHLAGQARADWYLLAPILAGFGLQVALMAELRQRRRQAHLAAAATGGGAGVSAVGMTSDCIKLFTTAAFISSLPSSALPASLLARVVRVEGQRPPDQRTDGPAAGGSLAPIHAASRLVRS